ncbi:hypothetical protein BDZ91DRAFT_735306 [Kalaharituber pfeilii]|nr:hypothetical protein BDZ91DRAFT_735306 [Kalaharituber pfeilii]
MHHSPRFPSPLILPLGITKSHEITKPKAWGRYFCLHTNCSCCHQKWLMKSPSKFTVHIPHLYVAFLIISLTYVATCCKLVNPSCQCLLLSSMLLIWLQTQAKIPEKVEPSSALFFSCISDTSHGYLMPAAC